MRASEQIIITDLGTAGGLSPRSYVYPYPTFPSTTIQLVQAASDFSGVSAQPVDTASPGNPYGNATAPQFNFPSGGWTILFAAITSAGPIDVRAGSIAVDFMPAANSASVNLTAFTVKLFSTTNIASPGSNSHSVPLTSRVGLLWTGTGASAGRWQTATADISSATANGTGADLSAIRFVQISGFGAAGFQLGKIRFVPNPRTKGAVIIRADDSALNQYTDLFPLMTAWGAQGVLMPSPLNTTIGKNNSFFLTVAQWQEMMNAGWQSASQGFTTEDNIAIDAMTKAQRYAEWAGPRTFMAANGVPSHTTDVDDGSYMSNFGAKDMIAGQDFRDNFRTLCNFTGGQATGNPLAISETFPPGDRYNITCLNMNSWGDVTDIYLNHLFLALEQTRAAKGILIIAAHNEFNLTNFKNALNSVGDYVVNQFPDQMEFTTLRKLWAPYNGDPILGSTGTGTMDFSIATGDDTGLLALTEDI